MVSGPEDLQSNWRDNLCHRKNIKNQCILELNMRGERLVWQNMYRTIVAKDLVSDSYFTINFLRGLDNYFSSLDLGFLPCKWRRLIRSLGWFLKLILALNVWSLAPWKLGWRDCGDSSVVSVCPLVVTLGHHSPRRRLQAFSFTRDGWRQQSLEPSKQSTVGQRSS